MEDIDWSTTFNEAALHFSNIPLCYKYEDKSWMVDSCSGLWVYIPQPLHYLLLLPKIHPQLYSRF